MFKAINLSDTREYICSGDPAIDHESSNLPMYQKTLDQSHLAFKEGEEPTIFILGTLPYRDFTRIQDAHITGSMVGQEETVNVKPFGMLVEAVKIGVKDIKNTDVQIGFVGGNPRMLNDATMNQLHAWGVIDELGGMILNMNSVQTEERKNS